jgi:hypothetical protein
MSYAADRAWSDQFIPHIRQIVGPQLLVESPLDVDTKEAADLIVLKARDMTVACRVRRAGYADRYPWDFTLRAKRDSGAKTELRKIVEGWGDWLLYGHQGAADKLARWFLVDLHELRAEMIYDAHRPRRRLPDPTRPIANGDGTHFVAYDVRNLPQRIVIASSHAIPRAVTEAA